MRGRRGVSGTDDLVGGTGAMVSGDTPQRADCGYRESWDAVIESTDKMPLCDRLSTLNHPGTRPSIKVWEE